MLVAGSSLGRHDMHSNYNRFCQRCFMCEVHVRLCGFINPNYGDTWMTFHALQDNGSIRSQPTQYTISSDWSRCLINVLLNKLVPALSFRSLGIMIGINNGAVEVLSWSYQEDRYKQNSWFLSLWAKSFSRANVQSLWKVRLQTRIEAGTGCVNRHCACFR